MHPAEFFRLLFPLSGPDDPRAGDLVRFLAYTPDVAWGKAPHHYLTRAELHAGNEQGVALLGFDTRGKDIYFTPHGVARRGVELTKADATALGDACWLELDDTDVAPADFNPLPSLVVATSPGRFHLYWLLADPLPIAQVEELNRRLVYGHPIHVDKGGWALTKWLRVPGTVSYKRQESFKVAVVDEASDPGRRYGPADFARLPAVGTGVGPAAELPVPNRSELREREELLKLYPLTREALDLLHTRRENRSEALWRLEKLLYRAGVSREDAFAIVAGSANDKFHADNRYHADVDLWKDIQKAYTDVADPDETPIQSDLKAIRQQAMPADEKRRRLAERILRHLAEGGRLYVVRHADDDVEALYFDGRQVITIDEQSQPWQTLLNLRYHINRSEKEFASITATVQARVSEEGEPVELHDFAHYDAARCALYVSLGGARVARLTLDGDAPRLEEVDNGADGVLFRDRNRREPLRPAPPPLGAPTLREAIFGLPNYENTKLRHSREQAERLAAIWTYALFFGEYFPAKPILVVVGPAGSGKTVLFQMLRELLDGPDRTVAMVPPSERDFLAAASNSRYLFLDNVDEEHGHQWLVNKLAEIGTKAEYVTRVLYTTNGMRAYDVACFLGLTTRNPWFTRVDVAQRLAPLFTTVHPTKRNLNDLLAPVRDHRHHLMHQMLTDLGRILRSLRDHKNHDSAMRMAGFADFVDVVHEAMGWRPEDAEDLIARTIRNQQETAADNSFLGDLLDAWVGTCHPLTGIRPNDGRAVTSRELHLQLKEIARERGDLPRFNAKIGNPKSLGHLLTHEEDLIRARMSFARERQGGTNRYRFTLPQPTEEATA